MKSGRSLADETLKEPLSCAPAAEVVHVVEDQSKIGVELFLERLTQDRGKDVFLGASGALRCRGRVLAKPGQREAERCDNAGGQLARIGIRAVDRVPGAADICG